MCKCIDEYFKKDPLGASLQTIVRIGLAMLIVSGVLLIAIDEKWIDFSDEKEQILSKIFQIGLGIWIGGAVLRAFLYIKRRKPAKSGKSVDKPEE